MAWTAEEKLRIAEVAVLYQLSRSVVNRLLSGRITKGENLLLKSMLRMAGRSAGRLPGTALGVGRHLARGGAMVAMRHPVPAALGTAALIYVNREAIGDMLAQGYEILDQPQFGIQDPGEFGTIRPGPMAVYADPAVLAPKVKRAISKANRAVKKGMQLLKSGGKKATGAKPGKLPKRAFIAATRAAGLANPKTMSKPGKAATVVNKLARKLIKWWKK